jgi:hypothetical protein
MHNEEIAECWIQYIPNDGYDSWSTRENVSARAHAPEWGGVGGECGARTDDKCPTEASSTQFKTLI